MVKKKQDKVKVRANGPYRISNKEFSYRFEVGEVKEVPQEHLNLLLDTKVIEEVKQ